MYSFKYLLSASTTQYLKGADSLGSNPISKTNKLHKLGQVVQPPHASFGIFEMEKKRTTYLKRLFIYLTNNFMVFRMYRSHSKLFYK